MMMMLNLGWRGTGLPYIIPPSIWWVRNCQQRAGIAAISPSSLQFFKKVYLQGILQMSLNHSKSIWKTYIFTHDWRAYLESCMDPEIGHTHPVIVILGQMDPKTRKIEARMQARWIPPINGHSVGATVVVDNFRHPQKIRWRPQREHRENLDMLPLK